MNQGRVTFQMDDIHMADRVKGRPRDGGPQAPRDSVDPSYNQASESFMRRRRRWRTGERWQA